MSAILDRSDGIIPYKNVGNNFGQKYQNNSEQICQTNFRTKMTVLKISDIFTDIFECNPKRNGL